MNNPAASCGVSELGEEICLKAVIPECFYRGSTVLLTTTLSHVEWVGGPVPNPPGFPTVREPHRPEGNRGIEACGNDGLRIDNLFNAASCEESTHKD
jgi:hypothetical protein